MNEALVTPQLLAWSRERAGLPREVLAKRANVSVARVTSWESGTARPTFKQATRWAEITHVPLGFLFLSEPPNEELPIPDLRTVQSNADPSDHADFIDTLRDVQFKMDWFRDYRLERGQSELGFVGSHAGSAEVPAIAADMHRVLNSSALDRKSVRNFDERLTQLVARCDEVGIWVMRSGVVGANSHRPLNPELFRGFAISDPIVPLVFINARDARAAQIFTLAHELAHLWVGQSGISDAFAETESPADGVETLCNAVAAEFLTPTEEFKAEWRFGDSLVENAARLSSHFRVSRIVVAIRARTLGLVTPGDFKKFLEGERKAWKKAREEQDGGGDYYRTARARNGASFVRAVLTASMSGELLLRSAGKLLDMKPSNLKAAYEKLESA